MNEDFSAHNNFSTEEDIEDEIALIMQNVRNKLEEVKKIRRMWKTGIKNIMIYVNGNLTIPHFPIPLKRIGKWGIVKFPLT